METVRIDAARAGPEGSFYEHSQPYTGRNFQSRCKSNILGRTQSLRFSISIKLRKSSGSFSLGSRTGTDEFIVEVADQAIETAGGSTMRSVQGEIEWQRRIAR